jgi:hypothetical protein
VRDRYSLQRSLLDRFAASASADAAENIEKASHGRGGRRHFKRFISMVETRKQQILERLLLDES